MQYCKCGGHHRHQYSHWRYDWHGNLKRKADIFTKRTIKKPEPVTSVDTAVEALSVSMGEKACVDLNYMSELYGKSTEDILFQNRSVFGFVYCKYIN